MILALSIVAAVAFAVPGLAQLPADPALVAEYVFDGDAADESGNGNDGVIVGATPTADRFGIPGRALSFDGVDDYVAVADNGSSLDITDDFTIALWMRPAAASGFILNKHINGLNNDGSWWLADFPPLNLFFQATPFPGGPLPGAGTSAPTPQGVWTFAALTYDDTTDAWKFYVDGVLDNSGSFDFQIHDTSLRLLIGTDDPVASFYTGELDDIRIYKRVLTAAEVLELFDLPPTPVPVEIDIKPGSDPNCINPESNGVIPVAILTTPDFDAATVDPFTVTLEGSSVRVKGKSGNAGSLEDVDGDGDLDLVVRILDASVVTGLDTAVLEATTFGGVPVTGADAICIVPD